ncbi:MAG: hypothetical protein ACFE8L_02195 [Candidatus Hodarchaeota archaeon]
MVQVLEKEEVGYELVIVPVVEKKAKEEVKEVKQKRLSKKHAKQHQELICVKNLKNKVYGNISGYRNMIK